MTLKGLLCVLALCVVLGLAALLRRNSRKPVQEDPPDDLLPFPVPQRRPAPPRPPPLRAIRTSPCRPSQPLPSYLDATPVVLPLGTRMEGSAPFVLDETHWSHMGLILGTTGSGKSRFAELIGQHLIDSLRGFCYIDPDGDTAENLFTYAMKTAEREKEDAICTQIHYIEASFEVLFGYDPFKAPDFSHLPPFQREAAFRSWLATKVDSFCEIVQRKQGNADLQGMPLLQRNLRTVLTAVGTAVDLEGTHFPLSDVLVLLDIEHPRHEEVFECVERHLPSEIRDEYRRMAGLSRNERLKESSSTLNRLRSLLGPLVQAIFAHAAYTINFREIIDERGILLVNLRESDFLSADQRMAIASLFIHEIWTASKVADRFERPVVPYYLFIDEAHALIGEDMLQMLARGRKYKLSLILIGQYLSQFKKGDIDMIPAILSLCRTFACFQQLNPEDLEILKKYYGYPNIDFTPLLQVMDRPDGYELIKLKDYAKNYTCGEKWDISLSHQEGKSDTVAIGHVEGESHATMAGVQHAASDVRNNGLNANKSVQRDSQGREVARTESGGTSGGGAAGTTVGNTAQTTDAKTVSDSVVHTNGTNTSNGIKVSIGGNTGTGISETEKTVPMQKTREEWFPTGRLREAIEDQFHRYAQLIMCMPDRHAIIRVLGQQRTFVFKVGDVADQYATPAEMGRQLKKFKQKIYAVHSYYVRPDLSPNAQDLRIDQFVSLVHSIQGGGSRVTSSASGLVGEYEDVEDGLRQVTDEDSYGN